MLFLKFQLYTLCSFGLTLKIEKKIQQYELILRIFSFLCLNMQQNPCFIFLKPFLVEKLPSSPACWVSTQQEFYFYLIVTSKIKVANSPIILFSMYPFPSKFDLFPEVNATIH